MARFSESRGNTWPEKKLTLFLQSKPRPHPKNLLFFFGAEMRQAALIPFYSGKLESAVFFQQKQKLDWLT